MLTSHRPVCRAGIAVLGLTIAGLGTVAAPASAVSGTLNYDCANALTGPFVATTAGDAYRQSPPSANTAQKLGSLDRHNLRCLPIERELPPSNLLATIRFGKFAARLMPAAWTNGVRGDAFRANPAK